MIRLRLLGTLEVEADPGRDGPGLLRQPKRAALLAWLASVRARPFTRRDTLLALFWPELDDTHARDALNSALLFLRRHLGPGVIASRGEEVGLVPGAVATDVEAFEAAAAAGRHDEAMQLYRGPFLDGFHTDAPGFEEWMERERARLRDLGAESARRAVEDAIAAGDALPALAAARRWAMLFPDDERAVVQLVQVLHAMGDGAAALREYDALAARLAREYELTPSAQAVAAVERVRRGEPVAFRFRAPAAPAGGAAAGTATVTRPPSGLRWAGFLGSAAATLTLIIVAAGGRSPAPAPDVVQLSYAGVVRAPVLSPDGRFLAYIRNECDSLRRCRDLLFVQDTAGISASVVASGTAIGNSLFWSADGRFLVYGDEVERGFPRIQAVAVLGDHAPRPLGCCMAARSGGGDTVILSDWRNPTVVHRFITLRDGRVQDSLVPVDPVPRGRGALTGHGRYLLAAHFLLDRRGRILDSIPGVGIGVCGPGRIQWPAGADAVYYLVCVPGMPGHFNIVRLAVGPEGRFQPPGDTVLRGLNLGGLNAFFHVSADERQLTYTINRPNVAVALRRERADDTRFSARLLASFSSRIHAQVSPDGQRVVIGRLLDTETWRWEYSILPFDSGPEVKLGVLERVVVGGLVWDADGSALIEAARPGGDTIEIARRDLATWERRPLARVRANAGALYAIPGGGVALHVRDGARDGFWRIGMPGLRDTLLSFRRIAVGGMRSGGSIFTASPAAVSPDGREIAAFTMAGDTVVLERMSLVTGAVRRVRAWPRLAIWRPAWLTDGTLQFGSPTSWYALGPGAGPPRLLGTLPYPVANYHFSDDGRHLVANVAAIGGDAFLVRNLSALIPR